MAMVNERREHDGDVAIDRLIARPAHLVAVGGEDGREVAHHHARHVMETVLHLRKDVRDFRKRLETGSVPAHNRVFRDYSGTTLEICENHTHKRRSSTLLDYSTRALGRLPQDPRTDRHL